MMNNVRIKEMRIYNFVRGLVGQPARLLARAGYRPMWNGPLRVNGFKIPIRPAFFMWARGLALLIRPELSSLIKNTQFNFHQFLKYIINNLRNFKNIQIFKNIYNLKK